MTGVYGQTGSHWQSCGFHTGTDFARYGYTEKPDLYSVCSGTVTLKRYENVLGNVVQIQDSVTGLYWRYCHMDAASPLSVGDTVTTSTVVGKMGQTGTGADGIHLHLECSHTSAWICSQFVNPSTQLGIPNISGTIVHYDGTAPTPPEPPVPPTPPPEPPAYEREKGFPWAAMTNNIRDRRKRNA